MVEAAGVVETDVVRDIKNVVAAKETGEGVSGSQLVPVVYRRETEVAFELPGGMGVRNAETFSDLRDRDGVPVRFAYPPLDTL
jgi:hypothetical protein